MQQSTEAKVYHVVVSAIFNVSPIWCAVVVVDEKGEVIEVGSSHEELKQQVCRVIDRVLTDLLQGYRLDMRGQAVAAVRGRIYDNLRTYFGEFASIVKLLSTVVLRQVAML